MCVVSRLYSSVRHCLGRLSKLVRACGSAIATTVRVTRNILLCGVYMVIGTCVVLALSTYLAVNMATCCVCYMGAVLICALAYS